MASIWKFNSICLVLKLGPSRGLELNWPLSIYYSSGQYTTGPISNFSLKAMKGVKFNLYTFEKVFFFKATINSSLIECHSDLKKEKLSISIREADITNEDHWGGTDMCGPMGKAQLLSLQSPALPSLQGHQWASLLSRQGTWHAAPITRLRINKCTQGHPGASAFHSLIFKPCICNSVLW